MSDVHKAGEPAGETTTAVETTAPATEHAQQTEQTTEQTETTTEAAQTEQTEGQTNEEEGDDKPRKRTGSQRLKSRNEQLLATNNDLQRRIDELSKKDSGEKAPEEKDYPGDYLAFERAKTAHDMRQAIRDEFRTRETAEAEFKQREIRREIHDAHTERVEDAREVIADYDAVMAKMRGVNVRQDVIDEIMESDKSALLAYHLANNPERLRALNGMNGKELAREIGRLEGSVRMPSAKKQTNAPPPLKQVKGGSTTPVNLETADQATYNRVRAAQEKARAGL